MAFQLHDNEQVDVSVEALTSEGNPANVTTTWASSDQTVVSVRDSGNNSATITASPEATGGLGTATVTATVTDQSDGSTHESTLEVEVVAGDATVFNIIPGEISEKAEGGTEPGGGEQPVIDNTLPGDLPGGEVGEGTEPESRRGR